METLPRGDVGGVFPERFVEIALGLCLGAFALCHMHGVRSAADLADRHEAGADEPFVLMGFQAVQKIRLVIAVDFVEQPRVFGVSEIRLGQIERDAEAPVPDAVGHMARVGRTTDNPLGR
ncbi:hypothetical protein [Streptomyces sp. NBC_01396]|uniref:hypothetical protein n=1 Tax=Streptomyces sp. NBC_01396 TaxID=2903852 RepID=UPI003252EB01